jgi:V/A-type H+-transporting ATPase subunit A
VTLVGAVSPPGGDFSEPITQYSLRLAGAFWALDAALARQRHFPAIDWRRSYTLYDLDRWFDDEVASDWGEHRAWALALLAREGELQEIVQVLGADTLGSTEQVVLRTGRLLREDFLQQSAFDDRDAYCAPDKQYWMLRAIRLAHEAMDGAVGRGVAADDVTGAPELAQLARLKTAAPEEARARGEALVARLTETLGTL